MPELTAQELEYYLTHPSGDVRILAADLRALAETVMRIRYQGGVDWPQLACAEQHARRVLGRDNA